MSAENTILKSIENVCQIVRSVKCSNEDKVDAYFTLFRYFQTNKKESVGYIGKSTSSLFTIVKKHLESDEKGLVEASLAFLGQALSVEEIIKECQENTLSSLCKVLCTILEENANKSIIMRTLWCFSHQALPNSFMKNYVKTLINVFVKVHTHENTKSETVNNEALRMLKRLCEQCPDELSIYLEEWISYVFDLLVTDVAKNREVALNVVEAGMEMLLRKQSYTCIFILDQFRNKDFCTKLNTLFHNDTAPVHVLNTWACMLRLLGESFFELNRVKVTNPLLKIAEKSFGSKIAEVTLALNNLWRALIDSVFTRPGEFGKRMEKIFLLPIRIRYKNEIIAQENLKTQWHLMCKIGLKINDYVEKALNPLMDVFFKRQDEHKVVHTPKSPYQISSKIKILAAEVLLQLLTEKNERQLSRSYKLELFSGPCLSNENVINNCQRYTSYLLNITEACGTRQETAVTHVWVTFLIRIRDIADSAGNTTAKQVWTPVLFALHEIFDQWMANCMLPLKILLLIPENVLKMTIPALDALVGDFQRRNPDSLVALFCVQLLLHKNSLDNESFDQERFFIMYERAIEIIFSSVTNQLQTAEIVFEYLKEANSDIKLENVQWRLWSTLALLLAGYISRTNDVNQSTNGFDNEFNAVLKSLTHPLKFIDVSKLTEGTMNELLKVWEEIFEIFTRSVALLSGVEINLALELVFHDISEVITTSLADNKLLQTIVQILTISSKYIDHSNMNKIFSSRLTPTKVTKKLNNPLGNLTSYVNVIKQSLNKWFKLNPKEGKVMDSAIIQLLNIIENFYEKVESSSVLTNSLHEFITPLTNLLDGNTSTKTFSSKITVKIENVLLQVYSAIENNKSLLFHSQLLQKLEPVIIKTLSSPRKLLRTRTGQFWNRTFGKTNELNYSKELQQVLTKYRSKLNLVLPGSDNNNTKMKFSIGFVEYFIDDTAQFPDSSMNRVAVSPNLKTKSATFSSPMKIHGSFMPSGKRSPKISSGKQDSPRNILGNFLASGSRNNSPKSPFKGNSKTVRRKLNTDDSCDYVEIKDLSPTKTKRILTEHQKDRIRERKELPAMYNDLDQSQDTFMRSLSQDLTQDSSQFLLPNNTVDEKEDKQLSRLSNPRCESTRFSSIPESNEKINLIEERCALLNATNIKSLSSSPLHNIGLDNPVEIVKNAVENEIGVDRSFEVIPSSQTRDEDRDNKHKNSLSIKRESLLTSQLLKSNQNEIKCSISEHRVIISSDSSSVDTVSDGNAKSYINTERNHRSNGDVCETEEIQLFESPTAATTTTTRDNQSKVKAEIVSLDSNTDQSCIDSVSILDDQPENPKGDFIESIEKCMDQDGRSSSDLNIEAKIVVDKLPSTRSKRKRSLPLRIPQTTEQQDKKRRIEIAENKPIENSVKNTRNRRKSAVENVGTNIDSTKATSDNSKDMDKKPRVTPEEVTDIFKFTDEKQKEKNKAESKSVKRRSGRRKSSKSIITVNKETQNNLEAVVGLEKAKSLSQKTYKDRFISIFDITRIEKTKDENDIRPLNDKISRDNMDGEEDVKEAVPESEVATTELNEQGQETGKGISQVRNLEQLNLGAPKEKDITESNVKKLLLDDLLHKSKDNQNSPTITSPVIKTLIKNPFVNHSISSPSRASFIPSPIASPATSILKKRLNSEMVDSPSPTNKRRVSFQLPSGAIILPEEMLAFPLPEDDQKPFTVVRRKSKEKKKSVAVAKPAVYPDLVSCTAPIEKILPSLTFSRGVGHLVRAQNILTVGDLSALSENQIEALPIRPPKVSTVRNVLKSFSSQISRERPIPKSPLVIAQPHDGSFMDSDSPTKDETFLVEEAALLLTPSRHHDDVKRRSDPDLNTTPELCKTTSNVSTIPELCTTLKRVDSPLENKLKAAGNIDTETDMNQPTLLGKLSNPVNITISEETNEVDDNCALKAEEISIVKQKETSEDKYAGENTGCGLKTLIPLLQQCSETFDNCDFGNSAELLDFIEQLGELQMKAISRLRTQMS